MVSEIPVLAVVMAVHNGETHLREAIDSVFAQTLGDFQLIVVDDASSDTTPEILADYAARDDRMVVLRNQTNMGPYPSANRALEVARAPLIARIDADDICRPERFARQVAFLDANPDHLLVGCSYVSIDERGRERFVRRNPMTWPVAQWHTRFRMPMVHPGFCFRRTLPDGTVVRYEGSNMVAQDYALAAMLASKGRIAVLDDVLVSYRMHSGNISSTRLADQNRMARSVSGEQIVRHYPPHLHHGLLTFLDVSYAFRAADGEALDISLAAMREALAFDADAGPPPAWARRRAAGLLAEAFIGKRDASSAIAAALRFAMRAPDMLGPLAMRTLEMKGLISPRPAPDPG